MSSADTRSKAYGTKLRRNRAFQRLILIHLGLGINRRRLNKLALGSNETLDLLTLYRKTERLGVFQVENLEKLAISFKPGLRASGLWIESAAWMSAMLADWNQEQKVNIDYKLPIELSIPPDPKKPGEESWIEARLLSILAVQVANQLLSPLNLDSASVEELEQLLGILSQPLPHATTPKPKIGLSQEGQQPAVLYFPEKDLIGDSFISHQIIYQQPETQQPETPPGKATWEILQQLGPEAAYTHLIFAASATDSASPWESDICLNGTDLIRFLGWNQRSDLSHTHKLKRLSSLVQMVCGLTVSICSIDLDSRQSSRLATNLWFLKELKFLGNWEKGNISEIGVDAISDSEWRPQLTFEQTQELVVLVSPGHWLKPFSKLAGAQAQSSLHQYGYLAKSTLQINPYRQPFAAKLAIFLTVMSRIQLNGRYRIATLIETLESPDTVDVIQQHPEQAENLLYKWDRALLTLAQLGWEVRFDPRSYPLALQPNWSLTETSPHFKQTHPQDWQSQWLNAQVIITPSTLIQHRLEVSKILAIPHDGLEGEINTGSELTTIPSVIPGYALEMALAAKGMSKSKLAEKLNLNRSMVTHWIHGSRAIQFHHRQQLWQLLGTELRQVTGIR